jgi:hypothetical protein
MLIFFDLILISVLGLFALSFLRLNSRTAWWLAMYLVGFTVVVISGIITSLLNVMNQPWAYLGLHAVLAGLAGGIWAVRGKPALELPWKGIFWRKLPARLFKGGLRWPDLVVFSLAVLAAYGLSAALIWVVPPNNNDALSTHMSRVGYWYQHGNLLPWPTHRLSQIFYTFNAQLQDFWTIVFWGTDRLVGFVQWLAGLAAGLGIFGTARLLGAAKRQALFAVLVWAAFPQVVLQSTSAQDSLVSAALVSASVYFLILAIRRHELSPLWLSSLAASLAVGTKQVTIFLVPGLFLLVVLCFFVPWPRSSPEQPASPLLRWHGLKVWIAGGVISFLLFNSYIFIQNLILYRNPLGPSEVVVSSSVLLDEPQSGWNSLKFNVPRLIYQSFDPTGIPDPWFRRFIAVKSMIAGPFFDLIGLDLEQEIALSPGHHFTYSVFDLDAGFRNQVYEDAAWYGVLGFLLLTPAVLYQFLVGLRRCHPLGIGVFVIAASFLVLLVLFRPGWDKYQGRYFLPVVTIIAPYLAFLFRSGWLSRFLRGFVLPVSIFIMVTVHTYNANKPLSEFRINMSDSLDVWTAPREDLITIPQRSLHPLLELLQKELPSGKVRLGVYFEGYLQDYVLFGEHFERELVPIYPFDKLNDAQYLSDLHLDYLLVMRGNNSYPEFAASGVLLGTESSFRLYRILP